MILPLVNITMVWQGLWDITDYKRSQGVVTNTHPSLSDELNLFYARFDTENHPEDYVLQTESEVLTTFRRVKAAGPYESSLPPASSRPAQTSWLLSSRTSSTHLQS